jgi:hypothetical protein
MEKQTMPQRADDDKRVIKGNEGASTKKPILPLELPSKPMPTTTKPAKPVLPPETAKEVIIT